MSLNILQYHLMALESVIIWTQSPTDGHLGCLFSLL